MPHPNDVSKPGASTSSNANVFTTSIPTHTNDINTAEVNEIRERIAMDQFARAIAETTAEAVDRALNGVSRTDYTEPPVDAQVNALSLSELSPPLYRIPSDNRPYIQVTANSIVCYPLLDSGAQVCIIGYTNDQEIEKFKGRIEPCKFSVSSINNENQTVTGVIWIKYEIGQRQSVVPTLLIKTNRSQFIVGVNFFSAFGIDFVYRDVLEKFRETFDMGERPVKPSKDEKNEHRGVPAQAEAKEKTLEQMTLPQPSYGVGMIALNQKVCARLVKSVGQSVPKWMNKWQERTPWRLPHKRDPILLSFEQSDSSTDRAETEVETLFETPDHSTTDQPSVASILLDILKNRPRKAWEISEVAIQTEIRTACDALDTENDVLPQKQTCVSQPHKLTPGQQQQLDEVLAQFPYTPKTGPLNCTHLYTQRIDTGDAKPEIRKQYPMSPYVLEEVQKEVEHLLDRDIIEKVSFSSWRWPILWVRKKTGGGRICVDARGLNKVTVPDAYPTLNVDTILRNLPRARYITSLDMTQAFHQMPIAEEDRNKTSFAVGHQFYRFKRALMGFTNSPADLAKLLTNIFHDLTPAVYHYVDDFILLSSTFEEHIALLKEVAKRLRDANLSISREKSSFCCQVTFLGYVLTENGLESNKDRIQPILDYPRPKTIKELRRLIGLVGWYRRFIYNVAEILTPLTDLTRGDVKKKIQWNEDAEKAFKEIRGALTSDVILSPPDYSLPFTIYTDASLIAGAAVLTQIQSGENVSSRSIQSNFHQLNKIIAPRSANVWPF